MNAKQQAALGKLAGEYADEPPRLGVHVGDLGKKAGSLSWSVEARMRFQDTAKKGAANAMAVFACIFM